MKLGEWFQINEDHDTGYPNHNIVKSIFEIYFRYFWVAIIKDKYGYEFYFNFFGIKFVAQQNKKERMKHRYDW